MRLTTLNNSFSPESRAELIAKIHEDARVVPVTPGTSSPLVFEPAHVPNDTSTWTREMITSVFAAVVETTLVTKLAEPQILAPSIDPEQPVVESMTSTVLFAGHAVNDKLDDWMKLFSNKATCTEGVDASGRATREFREVRVQRVLVRVYDQANPDEIDTRWINVNLTPSRLLDLVEAAWGIIPPDLTSPAQPVRVTPDHTSLHRLLTIAGPHAILNPDTCAKVIADLRLDPWAKPHLLRWNRRDGRSIQDELNQQGSTGTT